LISEPILTLKKDLLEVTFFLKPLPLLKNAACCVSGNIYSRDFD